jgi:hypothetical protein
MKKIIASACAVMAVSLASVLAHADDSMTPSNNNDSMHSDSAVTPPASATTESTVSKTDSMGNKMTSTSKWKNMKTCTDTDGITYYRGKKGYDNCLAQMKKSSKKDQMSGVSGTDTGTNSNMNSDSGNMSSSTTDTSGTH